MKKDRGTHLQFKQTKFSIQSCSISIDSDGSVYLSMYLSTVSQNFYSAKQF